MREHLSASGLLNRAIFDGDKVRLFCRDLGFSREDLEANIRRIGFLSKILTYHGVPNTMAIISSYGRRRQEVREMVGAFLDVYINYPLEVCE